MDPQNEIERDLLEKLMKIEPQRGRDPQRAADGLSSFLKEAQTYQPAVTNRSNSRLNGWNQTLKQLFLVKRKEFSPMSTVITILLATSLLFGTGGVTVAAAQNSMPQDTLYGLKLWSEDVRLNIITDPLTDFALSLEFMGRRAAEIEAILDAGETPSADLLESYQNRIEQTLRMALTMPEDQVKQSLELVRSRLVIQQQNLQQVEAAGLGDTLQLRTQIADMLQTRIAWTEAGITEPDLLQLKLRDGSGLLTTPASGSGNPFATGTPTPGSSYGPGSGDAITNTPRAYDHSGNPYTTGTPTPGGGYGPGSDQATGTPSGQTGYKPTETGAQTGQEYAPTQAKQESAPTRTEPKQPTSQGQKGGNK